MSPRSQLSNLGLFSVLQTAHGDPRCEQERQGGFPRLSGEAGCQEQRERGERH